MTVDCHAFGITQPFAVSELLEESALVLRQLLGPVPMPPLDAEHDDEWAVRRGIAVADRPVGEWSSVMDFRGIRILVDDTTVGTLWLGTIDGAARCSVSPARTPIGWTIAVGVALAGARLGGGTYSDERWSPPTLGLHAPTEVIAATMLRSTSATFADACVEWDAQFAEPIRA